MNDVFDRIDSLMKSQKKQYKELNEYLNLGKKTYDNWKTGKSSTYLKYLNEIAKFLNVTPNYLLNGVDEKAEITNVLEIELLRLFRSCFCRDDPLTRPWTKANRDSQKDA